jgi:hypothetical protein
MTDSLRLQIVLPVSTLLLDHLALGTFEMGFRIRLQ